MIQSQFGDILNISAAKAVVFVLSGRKGSTAVLAHFFHSQSQTLAPGNYMKWDHINKVLLYKLDEDCLCFLCKLQLCTCCFAEVKRAVHAR